MRPFSPCRLLDDHAHARRIARVFSDLGGGLFVPDVGPATTNLVVVAIADVDVVTPDEFLEMIQQPVGSGGGGERRGGDS